MADERRKHNRFTTNIPIRFNLNPDYHFVPRIKTIGVGGSARNVSFEGLLIHSRMDLFDVCQIFSEAFEDDSAFELEVFLTDSRERTELVRGAVRWYRLSGAEMDIQRFQAGLYLKEAESQAIARRIVESLPEG